MREVASGMAIAASVSEIYVSSCRSDLGSVKASQRPPARVTCSRTLLGAKQPWPVRLSPTRPQEVLGFEELLSELIARARMLCYVSFTVVQQRISRYPVVVSFEVLVDQFDAATGLWSP